MTKTGKRLGELLVEASLANPLEVNHALQAQKIFGDKLGTNLIELGVIDDDTLAAFLSRQYGVPRATREELSSVPKEILALVPARAAQRLCLLPLRKEGETLVVAMMDPSERRIIDRISRNLGLAVDCRVATEIEIRYYLEIWYGIPREPRHIILMRQRPATPDALEPDAAARTLAAALDRHMPSAQAIARYFDAIGSLEKIPVQNAVRDLTEFDLTPALTFVLHYVDGISSMREVLQASVYPRILTLRALIHLSGIGLIRFEKA